MEESKMTHTTSARVLPATLIHEGGTQFDILEPLHAQETAKGEKNLRPNIKVRNKRKKDNDKTLHEDQKRMNALRPNFFVGVPVSNPKIHKGVVKVQEQLLASQPALEHCLVDVASLHITLFVMSLLPNEVPLACSCLDQFSAQHSNRFSVPPITLNIRGVKHFHNQVVFADVSSDKGLQRLRVLRQAVLESFTSGSVAVKVDAKEEEQWCPHLTVAKLSKFCRAKKKKEDKLRRIEPSCYANFVDHDFGEALVTKVLLSAMTEPRDANRYYHCERSCRLDVESSEADDHSQCCFPRRPAVHSSRKTSVAMNATSPEGPIGCPGHDATCASDTASSFEANDVITTSSETIESNVSVFLDDTTHIPFSYKSAVLIDATSPSNVHVTATADTEADDLDASTDTNRRDTVSDTVGRDTVSDAVGRDTVSDAVGRDTVSDAVGRDTVSDTVGRDTVSDEVGRDIVRDTVGRDTVSDTVGQDTVSDANGRDNVSDANARGTVSDASV